MFLVVEVGDLFNASIKPTRLKSEKTRLIEKSILNFFRYDGFFFGYRRKERFIYDKTVLHA